MQIFKSIDLNIDLSQLPTPIYIVDERLIEKNLKILKEVIDRTGCKILLAQKAFSMFYLYPLIGQYLTGTTASSLFEAKLGYEEMKGREVHIYAPAYREDEFDEIIKICDHIIFNSFSQWNKYKDKIKASGKKIECGLRINPEYSEIETEIYNPCAAGSRLGITLEQFKEQDLEGIDGLHFHTMCEQNSDVLKRTIEVVDKKFGDYIRKMKWINFGGGHHITRTDYDIDTLIECIMYFKNKYNVEVYLEPGEAIALNAGYLAARVLDFVKNKMDIAILDTSAACHMPDVIEMPYRPKIIGAGEPGEYPYNYRFGGLTCLAGDIIGDYSFKEPLKEGDILVFTDMAIYTMVKNNTFNGVNLPAIASYNDKEGLKIIRQFGYEDFKGRLS
ncbi:MAG TPA: carboxynorspermidine decarboxylase [Defluviitaleaceae bacterium]|nr:carboxynorspermidine decarboxylase [Defluviitaleaceae bacterium]HPT75623.1 carboxynorspermidine decarboxylase [Defluviitaleaceae bacterium]